MQVNLIEVKLNVKRKLEKHATGVFWFIHQKTQAEFRETVHIFKIITKIFLNTETYCLNSAVMMTMIITI